jgi:hypothetical protein
MRLIGGGKNSLPAMYNDQNYLEKNCMQTRKTSISKAAKILSFHLSFSVIGLLLAIWFGFGWFILLQTCRQVCISIRPLYARVISALVGPEYVEEMLANKKGPLFFISWSSAFATLVMAGLTILFFWKINISIISIFSLIRK